MATIGLDLGGTKTLGVLVDGDRIVGKAKKSTPREGTPQAVLDTLARVVEKLESGQSAEAIGVGVPGPVRPGTGVLAMASNLANWADDVDIASELSRRCGGRPVVVDNDVNVATFAESRLGAGRGVSDLIGVFMGTGVGAALVLDGQLRQGPRGMAGELGHTYVDFLDFSGAEVGRGELEDFAGRRMMEARARAAHGAGEPTELVALAGNGRMKSSVWEKALAAGDPVAASIVDGATEAMAAALASAIALVDVELIVLGGGMAERLGPAFREDLTARLAARCFGGMAAEIRRAELGDAAGAVGAALLVEGAHG